MCGLCGALGVGDHWSSGAGSAALLAPAAERYRQAEAANHHPDIAFGWGHASVAFTTHSAKGVTLNDLIMAARLNLALPD